MVIFLGDTICFSTDCPAVEGRIPLIYLETLPAAVCNALAHHPAAQVHCTRVYVSTRMCVCKYVCVSMFVCGVLYSPITFSVKTDLCFSLSLRNILFFPESFSLNAPAAPAYEMALFPSELPIVSLVVSRQKQRENSQNKKKQNKPDQFQGKKKTNKPKNTNTCYSETDYKVGPICQSQSRKCPRFTWRHKQ